MWSSSWNICDGMHDDTRTGSVEAHQDMKELELLVARNERHIDRHVHCDETLFWYQPLPHAMPATSMPVDAAVRSSMRTHVKVECSDEHLFLQRTVPIQLFPALSHKAFALQAILTTCCQDPRQGKRAALRICWLQDLALNKETHAIQKQT